MNEIYQINFAQRKFVRENALNELTKSFQFEVWLLILISLITLSIIMSIKYWLLTKNHFFSFLISSVFRLIGHLLNNPGN